MSVSFTCKTCNKNFSVPPSYAARGTVKFCSVACSAAGKTGSANPAYVPTPTSFCPQCGKEVRRRQCDIKQGKRKFCSTECYLNSKRTATIRACALCGKNFRAIPSKIAIGLDIYCSKSCDIAAKSGERSPFWKGGRVEVNCLQCDKRFRVFGCIVLHGKGRFCRKECFHRWLSGPNGIKHTRARGGKRSDLNNLYVRSSWEANWARYLNTLIQKGVVLMWHYEVDTFRLDFSCGSRCYTPDFRVEYADGRTEYHEIKGYMDAKSRAKIEAMREQFSSVNLIVIAAKEYKEVEDVYKFHLPNWEQK